MRRQVRVTGRVTRLDQAEPSRTGATGPAQPAQRVGVSPERTRRVLLGTAVLTIGMALLAGVLALRSVRQIEPMSLLR